MLGIAGLYLYHVEPELLTYLPPFMDETAKTAATAGLVGMPNPSIPDPEKAVLFKAELDALMAKYPTIRLDVTHTISIVDLAKK